MSEFKRRKFLQASAGVAAGAAMGPLLWSKDANAQWHNAPEKGASLRVLRWSQFVQGDIDQYTKNVAKFSEKYGIPVKLEHEGWEDVRPKAAVAANTGAGPDIVLGTNDDANLYPEKLVDVTDLCAYLGNKLGGFYPVCDAYLRPDGKHWIGVPLGVAGVCMVYRRSAVQAAGFESFPRDFDGFLKLCQALKAKGTPAGFALGNATGDANTWCQWLVWGFGGKLVDTHNNVVIDSPETLKALEFAKELYPTFIPGTLSWLDPSNNKAFLDNQLYLTNNGISIYYAAKTSSDPKLKEMSADIYHANMPVGTGGQADRVPAFLQSDDLQVHEVPEGSEGVPALHDGARADRPLDRGVDRLCHSGAALLRKESDLDSRSQAHPLPRLDEEHASFRLRGKDGLRVGWRARRLHRRQHGRRSGIGGEDSEGSRRARAEACRALLQGVTSRQPAACPSLRCVAAA